MSLYNNRYRLCHVTCIRGWKGTGVHSGTQSTYTQTFKKIFDINRTSLVYYENDQSVIFSKKCAIYYPWVNESGLCLFEEWLNCFYSKYALLLWKLSLIIYTSCTQTEYIVRRLGVKKNNEPNKIKTICQYLATKDILPEEKASFQSKSVMKNEHVK